MLPERLRQWPAGFGLRVCRRQNRDWSGIGRAAPGEERRGGKCGSALQKTPAGKAETMLRLVHGSSFTEMATQRETRLKGPGCAIADRKGIISPISSPFARPA